LLSSVRITLIPRKYNASEKQDCL